jgi:hypothetical protein
MSTEGRLTEAQQKMVEEHVHVADRAGHWLTRPYRMCGKTDDEAKSDAYAWLVLSAFRYDPAKGVRFMTYYLSNVKWWRSDVLRLKPAEVRHWKHSKRMGRHDSIADKGEGLASVDRDESWARIESAVMEQVPYGQYLIDMAHGLCASEIAAKYGKRSKAAIHWRVVQAKRKARVVLQGLLGKGGAA